MLTRRTVALGCLSLALIAACPAAASAAPGEYAVDLCKPGITTGGGTVTKNPQTGKLEGSGLFYEADPEFELVPCNVEGSFFMDNREGVSVAEESSALVTLVAPEGTTIKELSFSAPFTRPFEHQKHPSFLQWIVTAGNVDLLPVIPYQEDGRDFFAADGGGRYSIGKRSSSFGMICEFANCGTGELFTRIGGVGTEVQDEFLPGISSPELSTRTLRGSADVGFKAVDKGSGISKVELVELAGDQTKTLASMSDDNGGKCVVENGAYKYMQPCKLEIESSFPLDTTKLAEGQHEIALIAADASGLVRESPPLTVLVHNAPTNLVRPVIQGHAHLGVKLKATPGTWVGDPTTIAYRWFRCPGSVRGEEGIQSCRAISGATGAEYTTGKEDLGKRDLVEVVATNSFGSESSLSFPSDEVDQPGSGSSSSDKPVLTHLRLSRKRFRVGTTLSKGKRGAVLAFTSSRGGQVSIVIRRLRGHRKPKPMGKLVAPVKAGRSRILLSGEIGKRRLRPGPYAAVVRVTDPKGTASDPAKVRFRIIPG